MLALARWIDAARARGSDRLGVPRWLTVLGMEVAVALALAATSWRAAGVWTTLAIPLLVVRADQLRRSEQPLRPLRSLGVVLGLALLVTLEGELRRGHTATADVDVAIWWNVPFFVLASTLVVAPERAAALAVGIALAVPAWLDWASAEYPWPILLAFAALGVGLRAEPWRIVMTRTAAGAAIGMASLALAYEHQYYGGVFRSITMTHTADPYRLRLVLEASLLISGMHLLRDRTWSLLAVIGTASALALARPWLMPGFPYRHTCMPAPVHPLDHTPGLWMGTLAIGLAALWVGPLWRAWCESAETGRATDGSVLGP